MESSLISLRSQDFAVFVREIGKALASFDWRTSSTPDLDEQKRREKLVFRGSGGYKEIRSQLLEHLASQDSEIGTIAKRLVANT